MAVNKVILLGRLGKDPDLRYTSQQFPIANFSLATNDRRKDQSGNWVEHTEWHNIVTFGKVAENCKNYLKKGREVYVEGRLQTRKWQDKEGRDRYTTEILANTVQFIGGQRQAAANGTFASEGSPMEFSDEQSSQAKGFVDSLPSADNLSEGSAKGGTSAESSFEDDDIPF